MVDPVYSPLDSKPTYFGLPLAVDLCGVTVVGFFFRSTGLKSFLLSEAVVNEDFSVYKSLRKYDRHKFEDVKELSRLVSKATVFKISPMVTLQGALREHGR